MIRRALVFLSGLVAADFAGAAAWRTGGSAAATWAENVSRSAAADLARDAFVAEAGFNASHDRPLAPYWSARLRGEISTRLVPEFERNSRSDAGLELTVQRKLGLGPSAPSIAGGVSLHRREARLAAADAWRAEARLQATKRVTETVGLSAFGEWHEDYARHASFDTRVRRLGAEAAWDLTERWRAGAGVARLWGDFTVHASSSFWREARSGQLGPEIAQYYSTIAWLATDSYGPGWVSYRIDGRANVWWLDLAPALGDRTTLVLRHESVHTRNGASETYRQRFWTLRIVHAF